MTVAHAPCRLLDWDSRFFGCRVARVEASRLDAAECQHVLDWCGREGVRWLHFLADADDAETVRVTESAAFSFVDIRLQLAVDGVAASSVAASSAAPPPGVLFRDAIAADVGALEAIAADVHRDSRFFFDERLPPEQAERLYQTWIRRSVVEGFADYVIVADVAGQAQAYITGHRNSVNRGSIGLLGVHAALRGKSVGPSLIRAVLSRFGRDGVDEVTVVTQGRNVAAQRAYQRCGFRSQSVGLWYHRWFE